MYKRQLSDYLSHNDILFGHRVEEAQQAVTVSLIGVHPQETIDALAAAGCQVRQLPTDPGELLNALENPE